LRIYYAFYVRSYHANLRAKVVGHESKGGVTGLDTTATNDDRVFWLNRAAAFIDGEPRANVLPMAIDVPKRPQTTTPNVGNSSGARAFSRIAAKE